MFALDAPATATANATFSITAWVFVNQGSWGHLPDRPNPTSFTASIDPASRTITVTGTITRTDRNPNALGPCVVNFMAVQPLPASVSLPVAVASGSYTLVIPPTAFSSQVALPGIATVSYPLPLATRSILIQ